MRRNKPFVAAIAAVVAFSLGACTPSTVVDDPESSEQPVAEESIGQSEATPIEEAVGGEEPEATPEDDQATASEQAAGALAAITLAESTVGGQAFNLDWERGRWEIALIADGTEYELYVTADGAEVTKQESERAEREDIRLLESATLTMAEAINTALAANPTAELVEADLDTRRGATVWEIEVRGDSGRQVIHVDATTGEVL